ncbi:MAG TPA: hypothetical protein VF596_02850 [Pyrinomonadaceae bacterium]|jgi:hypothetical protein
MSYKNVLDKLLPVAILLLLFACVAVGTDAAGAINITDRPALQTAYEMRCRGGRGLRFSTTPGRNLPTGEQMMNVTMNFNAASKPANNSKNLEPGQCSWVDRTLRKGEPTQIRLELVANGQLKQVLHGTPASSSPTQAEVTPDAINVPDYLSSSSHYWIFRVYNSNEGYLQATGSKYYKPPILLNPNEEFKPINKLKVKPPPKP